ncbi:MAG: hypothetical protein ACI9TP_001468 [Candidatus Azotimanducaceae bacterium]|jgi:hypothetical protein
MPYFGTLITKEKYNQGNIESKRKLEPKTQSEWNINAYAPISAPIAA